MGPLIGTRAGIFDLDGSLQSTEIDVVHLTRGEHSRWAIDQQGQLWHDDEVAAQAPGGARLNCVQPTPDGVWIGADSAQLFLLQDGRVGEDEFFADAPGRDSWHTPWGGPPDVRSMTYDRDGVLYVNVHVGGILRYDNTGLTPTVDIGSDVHQVTAHPERGATVLAATAWGLAQTTNGHEFQFRTEGLHARYCRAVAVWQDTVLISASQGPNGGHSRLYRGNLRGGPLEPCEQGLPASFQGNVDTHCLTAGPDGFFAGNGETVWGSADRGETWEVAVTGVPTITCLV